MSYVSIHGLTVALAELLAMGPPAIETHARKLARHMIAELDRTGWTPFRSLDDDAATSHIVTLGHPNGRVDATVTNLKKNMIVCGSRNERIRISLAHFNDENDIRSLVKVLQQA